MSSQFTTFHYQVSQMEDKFDHGREDFDIKEISTFYRLKHERTSVSLFMDKMFSKKDLGNLAFSKADYNQLYVKTKLFSHLANQQFDKL